MISSSMTASLAGAAAAGAAPLVGAAAAASAAAPVPRMSQYAIMMQGSARGRNKRLCSQQAVKQMGNPLEKGSVEDPSMSTNVCYTAKALLEGSTAASSQIAQPTACREHGMW